MSSRLTLHKARIEKSRLWKLSEFYALKANYIQLIDERLEKEMKGEDYGTVLVREKEVLGDAGKANDLSSMYFEQSQGISNLIADVEKETNKRKKK